MTKTSKRKLIVTSALVLGAVATVGTTFGVLIVNGGNRTGEQDFGINTVTIKNQVVNLQVEVVDGTLNFDGWENEETDKNGQPVGADEANDRKFSLKLTVTGDPKVWDKAVVSFAWDEADAAAATYLKLPDTAEINVTDFLDKSGEGAETVSTITKEFEINWQATYSSGIVNYLNTNYSSDVSGAVAGLQKFQTDVSESHFTATVSVDLAA